MRWAAPAAGIALLCGGLVAVVLAAGASADRSGCHAAHSCPSDHDSYLWTDPRIDGTWGDLFGSTPEAGRQMTSSFSP